MVEKNFRAAPADLYALREFLVRQDEGPILVGGGRFGLASDDVYFSEVGYNIGRGSIGMSFYVGHRDGWKEHDIASFYLRSGNDKIQFNLEGNEIIDCLSTDSRIISDVRRILLSRHYASIISGLEPNLIVLVDAPESLIRFSETLPEYGCGSKNQL